MLKKFTLFALIFALVSCKTYNVSKESFRSQVVNYYTENLDENERDSTTFLYDKTKVYKIYGMDFFNVNDKKGNPYELEILPGAQVKFTLDNGQKRLFYLQSLTLENDSIKGYKSYIFNLKNAVSFNQISKIELQEDKAYQKHEPTPYEKSLKIRKKTEKIFKNRGEELKDYAFKLDSIDVRVSEFRKVYFATCEQKNNLSTLKILYEMLEDDSLAIIAILEQNRFEPEIDYLRTYYLENDNFIYQKNEFLPKDFNEKPDK
uniref:hypothetical protein n=1 Tax=Flavobacterium sp. TaxID=239 RepID=UPI00404B809A